jgi:hypothetical protein
MAEKTHWKKQFNYDYLGSYSLPDGRDVVLTIKSTKKEKVVGQNGKKEECFVCVFTEQGSIDWIKPMILNRTNCKTITKLYGTPYIEEWAGKKVQIGIERVSAFGDLTDALRIRNVIPDVKRKAELLPGTPQWDQAVKYLQKEGNTIGSIEKKYELSEENKQKLIEASL